MKIFDLATGGTDEVMVVAGKLLGQLKAAVVICAHHSSHHTRVDQRSDVAVGTRLRQIRRRIDDLWDCQRASCMCKHANKRLTQGRVALAEPNKTYADQLLGTRRQRRELLCREYPRVLR